MINTGSSDFKLGSTFSKSLPLPTFLPALSILPINALPTPHGRLLTNKKA
jgi:hypothetical protein